MKVIEDWLEDKLAARQKVLGHVEDASEFSMLAGALRAEAQADGYSPAALVTACGGDICSYLMQATQHSVTFMAAESLAATTMIGADHQHLGFRQIE